MEPTPPEPPAGGPPPRPVAPDLPVPPAVGVVGVPRLGVPSRSVPRRSVPSRSMRGRSVRGPRLRRGSRDDPRHGVAAALANNLVVAVVAVVVLGVAGTALALGAPSRPSLDLTSAPVVSQPPTSPTAAMTGVGSTAPAGAAAPAGGARLGRANLRPGTGTGRTGVGTLPGGPGGHGTITITTAKGSRTVVYDRGTVTGLTYGAITLEHPDNSPVTMVITGATRFRPSRYRPRVGDTVAVWSDAGRALVVVDKP